MKPDTALVLIDVQANVFSQATAVHRADELLSTLTRILKRARAHQIPVIYMQNNGGKGDLDETGTTGYGFPDQISPANGDIVIQKFTPDAFHDTDLQEKLAENGIRRLLLAGAETEMSVDTTCRRAASLGFQTILLEDGHSTRDSDHLSASQIIAHHNDILSVFADVKPAERIKLENGAF